MIRQAVAAFGAALSIASALFGAALPAVAADPYAAPPAQPRGFWSENFTFYSSPYRKGPWIGPACEDPRVLKRVSDMFDETEKEYWHTGLRMAAITYPRETTFRVRQPPLIARRYCTATAYLTDGSRYELVYQVDSEQGFAGVGWGVLYCLVGRDPMMAYEPACKMLRPL